MHEIDAAISKTPLLLNDLFRHRHARRTLKVFLCGRKPSDRRFDLRIQVKRLLEGRMGCKSFLGEDIAELTETPRPDKDHLTIEVKEAKKSDLIVMFLGSPGTLAEVTAFAMNRDTNKKLVVFNNIKYKNDKSFINLGPLRLLPRENVIFYDPEAETTTAEVVVHLDKILARTWFGVYASHYLPSAALSFEQFILLCVVYAAFPVRYAELGELFPFNEKAFRDALKALFLGKFIQKQEDKFIPVGDLQDLAIGGDCVADIARVRTKLLDKRLQSDQCISDYRLIV